MGKGEKSWLPKRDRESCTFPLSSILGDSDWSKEIEERADQVNQRGYRQSSQIRVFRNLLSRQLGCIPSTLWLRKKPRIVQVLVERVRRKREGNRWGFEGLDWDFAKLVVIHLLSLHPLALSLSSDAIGRDLATDRKSGKARKIRYLQQHKSHQAREQTMNRKLGERDEGRDRGKVLGTTSDSVYSST